MIKTEPSFVQQDQAIEELRAKDIKGLLRAGTNNLKQTKKGKGKNSKTTTLAASKKSCLD